MYITKINVDKYRTHRFQNNQDLTGFGNL